jgi:hypothetical protein
MRPFRTWLVLLAAALGSTLAATAAAQESRTARVDFEFYEPQVATERLQAVAEAVGFNDWPRPDALFVAPRVGRELFTAPGNLGREVRSCSAVRFADEPWGRCEWTWRPARDGSGWLDLSLTLAPTSRAAQEYLLSALTDNMLPAEAAAATLRGAVRPEGLGDVAFSVSSRAGDDVRLDFTRANLAVRIRARGSLAGDSLGLARRLDARVLDQHPLTRQQLLARRPTVRLAAVADGRALPYTLQLPGAPAVVALQAQAGGRAVPAAQGRLMLAAPPEEPTPVEIVVITAELLAAETRTTLSTKR